MAYTELRNIQNKPGIVFDEDKLWVLFAEDWTQVKNNFDYLKNEIENGGGVTQNDLDNLLYLINKQKIKYDFNIKYLNEQIEKLNKKITNIEIKCKTNFYDTIE